MERDNVKEPNAFTDQKNFCCCCFSKKNMKSTASLKRRRSSKQRLHCQSIENYKTKTTDKKEFVMNSRSNLKTNFERETKKSGTE